MVKRITSLICALGAAFTMTACGDKAADTGKAAVQPPAEEEYKVQDIVPDSSSVKPLGRSYFKDGRLYCTLSGTGAAFTFTGTECTVRISGDSNAGTDNQARAAIYVNGERVIDDLIDKPEEEYSVFKSDTPAYTEVRIVKLSEAPMSAIALGNITVNGKDVKPAEDKPRLIEFIGDSITCGYGVDDEVKEHHFSTSTEDVTKTYAYKTAEKLGADYSMVCFSGHGIISGYSDGKKKAASQLVPKYYNSCGYIYGSMTGFDPKNTEWDFSRRQPDVIVINLGTNDDSYCKSMDDRCEEFCAEYVNFLKEIRKNNPDARIVCTLGIMGNNLYPYIEKAVYDYTSETGDSKVTSMLFENQQQADGIAADWHPSEKTHEKAAEKLSAEIRSLMGWN